jgi:hypothetical protein
VKKVEESPHSNPFVGVPGLPQVRAVRREGHDAPGLPCRPPPPLPKPQPDASPEPRRPQLPPPQPQPQPLPCRATHERRPLPLSQLPEGGAEEHDNPPEGLDGGGRPWS